MIVPEDCCHPQLVLTIVKGCWHWNTGPKNIDFLEIIAGIITGENYTMKCRSLCVKDCETKCRQQIWINIVEKSETYH